VRALRSGRADCADRAPRPRAREPSLTRADGRAAAAIPLGRRTRLRTLAIWVAAAGVAAVLVVAAAERIGSRTLMLSPGEAALQQAHGTWHRMFETGGVVERAPVLLWVVALVVLGVLGLPYVWLAARSLPDRGFALARPVGLLLVTWLVWWGVSLRLFAFTRGTIALAALAVAVGAGVIAVVHRDELGAWARRRWRVLAIEEGVFWTLFAATVLVRWSNPDLWHPSLGGEKPMDLAYLNAVVKSTHFPPFDPWFAGGQMNYYYLGFVLVGLLVKTTSIAPAVAYNLAVPTLAAMLGAAAFSATLALADARTRLSGRRVSPLLVALLGAILVSVVGNLGELRVLADSLHRSIPIEWWYWNPTRVINHPLDEPGLITEFPSFTYLYADLHAHAMALPFTVVALALAVAVLRRTDGLWSGDGVLLFTLLALVLGALWPLNTWDVPTYVLIVTGALLLAQLARRGLRGRAVATAAAQAAVLVGAAYVLYLPFHLRYDGVFEGVARWHGSRTSLADYLTIHGLVLFAIASAVVLDLWVARDANAVVRSARLTLRSWERLGRLRELRRVLVRRRAWFRLATWATVAAVLLSVVLAILGMGVPALGLAIGIATLHAIARRPRRAGRDGTLLWQATLGLVVLALALTLAVEFLVARNIDIGRTNTVFKLYLQVWVLWGIAAAVSAGRVYERLGAVPRAVRVGWRVAFITLLAVAALYPLLATPAKIDDRFDTSVGRTLDGAAFMERAVFTDHDTPMRLADDAEAIRWFQENVDGSPVVAEVNTTPTLYGWGNRYAMFTGNPAIVGWDYHQRQQRPPQSELVGQRVGDVQAAYRTSDPALADRILRRYGTAYVVVGPLERTYFPEGDAKWTAGEGRFWTLVHSNASVRVYRLLDS
jgi:YYY domain-containing protein